MIPTSLIQCVNSENNSVTGPQLAAVYFKLHVNVCMLFKYIFLKCLTTRCLATGLLSARSNCVSLSSRARECWTSSPGDIVNKVQPSG